MADTRFKKGQIPWNKTEWIKKTCPTCGASFSVKPSLNRVNTCSRGCALVGSKQTEETKARRIMTMKGKLTHTLISRGESRPAWKGDRVSYSALHAWVRRYKGTPDYCEQCSVTEKKRYHWANVDHQYKRNLEDWIRLCPKCHKAYDKALVALTV